MYPLPTTLVGANVSGKPNYQTIAYCGIVHHKPAMIAVNSGKRHYTNAGIKENGTFSVDIPSEELVTITDYCGIVSGRRVDNSILFDTFYGTLKTAPMIQECPLNLECKLVQTLDYGGSAEIFIGKIVEAYAEKKYLTNGLQDITKIKPIIFSMHDNTYWKLGEQLAHAFSIGKKFIARR